MQLIEVIEISVCSFLREKCQRQLILQKYMVFMLPLKYKQMLKTKAMLQRAWSVCVASDA